MRKNTRVIFVSISVFANIALAQPTQKLPGGAVLKPGHPPPVVPLAAPSEMRPLEPLVGHFVATSAAGVSADLECAAILDGAWLACDLRGPLAAKLLLGWDGSAHGYRGLVVDAAQKSRVYKGALAGGTLSLRAPGSPPLALALTATPLVATVGAERWTLGAAR